MGVRLEILCVNKSHGRYPHETISHIGGYLPDGTNFMFSHEEAINYIEQYFYDFYIITERRSLGVTIARTMRGKKYLKTIIDFDRPINLLKLPECM